MATQTDAALAEALRAFVENAAQAKNFALEQAPEVIQQLLAWKLWANSIGLVIGLAFLALSGWCAYRAITYKPTRTFDDCSGLVVVAGMSGAIGLTVSVCSGLMVLKILIAPKVYLLEYATALVR